jgi:DNA-binding NarL/FixJ family response regulator
MQINHTDGDRRFLLLAMPLPQALSPHSFTGGVLDDGRALVIVRDQTHPAALGGDMLKAIFGLTEAEVAVATSLCGGRSPETIADERGVSLATIRTQVRHILEKAGVRSLRELEAILIAP